MHNITACSVCGTSIFRKNASIIVYNKNFVLTTDCANCGVLIKLEKKETVYSHDSFISVDKNNNKEAVYGKSLDKNNTYK